MKNTNVKEVKKVNWKEVKNKAINMLKFVIFVAVTYVGFWAIFSIAWYLLGFQVNTTAATLLGIQALVSEIMFFRWFV
jgi:hypothetical protein